jgi:hypothetical protein
MLFPSLSAELIKGSAVYSWVGTGTDLARVEWNEKFVMAEKFDPAPADKHADTSKLREAADKKADDELKKGLKDSFPASDPPSSIQPSKTVKDAS